MAVGKNTVLLTDNLSVKFLTNCGSGNLCTGTYYRSGMLKHITSNNWSAILLRPPDHRSVNNADRHSEANWASRANGQILAPINGPTREHFPSKTQSPSKKPNLSFVPLARTHRTAKSLASLIYSFPTHAAGRERRPHSSLLWRHCSNP